MANANPQEAYMVLQKPVLNVLERVRHGRLLVDVVAADVGLYRSEKNNGSGGSYKRKRKSNEVTSTPLVNTILPQEDVIPATSTPLVKRYISQRDVIPALKQRKTKSCKSSCELNKALYSENNAEADLVDDIRYGDIENSKIRGYDDNFDGFLYDDDCLDDYTAHLDDFEGRYDKNFRAVPEGYAILGPPAVKYDKCNAFMWKEERLNKSVTRGMPKFNICCGNGKISLPKAPATPSYLWQLYNDPEKGPAFHRCSRIYNICRSESGREDNEECRDVIVKAKVDGLQRVTSIHPKLMAFQYPLLFPTGEDGFHEKLYYQSIEERKGKKRQKLSMKYFYSYKFQVRHNEGMTARLGRKITLANALE
ncbi:hypothetical protein POM88_038546 [Heracleum sosnowskyi]|uniref:Uncharacterized protein n=1 Tax=Heracleum sosnowskyi TaxID=360622 RepID=A0AAD8M5J6_9APIA|nr:hypothetical protein POM88_038546 [Heracleum sosnowskyi]